MIQLALASQTLLYMRSVFFLCRSLPGYFIRQSIRETTLSPTAALTRFETEMSGSATRDLGFTTPLRPPICNPYFCKAS